MGAHHTDSVSVETDEIKKLKETISELQLELKFLQETVGVLVGAMMEEGESEEFFGNGESGNPTFRLNMGM
mgnify:CR=1 FL=1|jgi:hypothetical protein